MTYRPRRGTLVAALLGVSLAAGAARGVDPSSYRVADPSAPPVTAENLFENERFWPHRVALRRAYAPEGSGAPLAAGTRGILVRVETSGVARVDFGRPGRYAIPVSELDVVEVANRVRTGGETKLAPNLVYTLGTRLVDSNGPAIRPLDLSSVYAPKAFLVVFADPSSEGFDAVAEGLAPFRETESLMTVLLPQGMHPDVVVRDRLRALAWPVPFVRDEYGEGYARSIRGEAAAIPAVMLLSPEGRVLLDLPWNRDEVVPQLRTKLAQSLGAHSAASLR